MLAGKLELEPDSSSGKTCCLQSISHPSATNRAGHAGSPTLEKTSLNIKILSACSRHDEN